MRQLCVVTLMAMAVAVADNRGQCDPAVIQCINGQGVSLLTSLKILWRRDYSIVYYSSSLAQDLKLTCITTKFSVLGNKDTYHHSCKDADTPISFKTGLNLNHTMTISNYLKFEPLLAHAVYVGDYCLGLYVCSQHGATGWHTTIYCPTRDIAQASSEIQAARERFAACHVDDGVALCQDPCYQAAG